MYPEAEVHSVLEHWDVLEVCGGEVASHGFVMPHEAKWKVKAYDLERCSLGLLWCPAVDPGCNYGGRLSNQ